MAIGSVLRANPKILLPNGDDIRRYGKSIQELREPPQSMTIRDALTTYLEELRRSNPSKANILGDGYEFAITAFQRNPVSQNFRTTGVIGAGDESVVLELSDGNNEVLKIGFGTITGPDTGPVRNRKWEPRSCPVEWRYPYGLRILDEGEISVVLPPGLKDAKRSVYYSRRPKATGEKSWIVAYWFNETVVKPQGDYFWDLHPGQLCWDGGQLVMWDDNAAWKKVGGVRVESRELALEEADWIHLKMERERKTLLTWS